MFVDEITIRAKAGKGGDGVVRWLHEKGRPRGGPVGGDGGRGGDVLVRGVRDLGRLAQYRFVKEVHAEDGEAGKGNNQEGKSGAHTYIDVPIGTRIINVRTQETHELLKEGEEKILLSGGNGGYGNAHFKSSTNQYPLESTRGKRGEEGDFRIELQLIADVGIIGMPNAGKSSLLNALTKAHSKVGSYPFTTLEPHLGDFHGYVLADIPGLIEGASEGRGLGDKFLRHVRRTKFLVHLVSLEDEDPYQTYTIIRKELSNFDPLLSEKDEIILLSKADLVNKEDIDKKIKLFGGLKAIPFSVIDDAILKDFARLLSEKLQGS